jgi:hypothetical protein
LKTGKTVFLILKLAYLPAIGQSAFEAVSKRKRQSFLEKELKGYVDSLAEIINDMCSFEEKIQLKLFLELLSQQQNNSYS